MKKRYLIFIFLILFSIGIFIINATVDKTKGWHSGNIFLIKIDNNDKTLQQAITEDLLRGSHTYAQPSSTSIPDPGHSAEQIWVSINGNENTLLQTLSSANKLCDSNPGTLTTSYSSSPTDKSKAYHFANQIEVTVGTSTMSLQEAIDNGKFNPSNFGQSCGGSVCINPGTIQCDGTCSGTFPKADETGCGIKDCDYLDTTCEYCDYPTCRNYNDVNKYCRGGTCVEPACDSYTNAPKGTVCETGDKLCGLIGNCIDIRELVRESLGYREEWRSTVETHTSCGGSMAFYSKERVMDGNDDTYSWANLYFDDSYDPLTCVYDWTVSLPSSGPYSLNSVYIRKIEFITAIGGTPGSAGRSRRLWLEYYDGSWHTSYDSGAVTNSEGKTRRTFYITDPTIQRVSKIRVRVEVKRTSKYQVIMHKTSDYSMKMFGITTSYG